MKFLLETIGFVILGGILWFGSDAAGLGHTIATFLQALHGGCAS